MTEAVSDERRQYGFIHYRPGDPPHAFFQNLITARSRAGAGQSEALQFLDGHTPYEGAFVARAGDVPGPVSDFPRVADAFRRATKEPEAWPKTVQDGLNALLANHAQAAGYFASVDYRQTIDRVWQSYFATVITAGFDQSLQAELAKILWLAHVIDLVAAPGTAGAEGLVVQALSQAQVRDLTSATITLPSEVFPLPPRASSQEE